MPHRSDIPENIKRVTKTPKKIQPTCTNSSSSRVPLPSSSKAAKSSRARFPSKSKQVFKNTFIQNITWVKVVHVSVRVAQLFQNCFQDLDQGKINIWGSTKTFTFFQNCFQDLDCVFDYKPLSAQELKKQLLPSSFLSLRLLRPWELLLSLLSPNHKCYHKGAL